MKLFLHPHHHDQHHDKPPPQRHHKDKKGRKIMKKMARLERKLSKYRFDSSSPEDSCPSDAGEFRSRSLSRSHKRRKGRSHHRHRRHGRRFASRGRGSSSRSGSRSSSSSSSSGSSSGSSRSAGSSSSRSSSSSKSPSPCERRFHARQHAHRRGPPGRPSRSQSFAGRAHRSPSPFSRAAHRHRHHRHHRHHGPAHHRGRFWHHRCRRLQDGLRGYFAMLPDSGAEAAGPAGTAAAPGPPDVMDLVSRSRSASRERGPRVPSAPAGGGGDVPVVEQEAAERGSLGGPEIDGTLAENWSKIAREGLPSGAKSDLLRKYSVSKNCSVLRGPKLNDELLPVASESGVKYDTVQMQQQNQLGAGLTALGKAITDLSNKTQLKEADGVVGILEELNEAAVIIVDAHRNMTKVRQSLMQSELNKRVRPVVDNCEHDEFLYGKDFSQKIEHVKGFGKFKRGNKKHERQGRYGKGEKRKQHDQDGGQRCKHSNFVAPHGGSKIH